MNPIRIINSDVIEGLRQLEDRSVNCVVTSPPYWGLRDYGTAKWEGGDTECEHIGPSSPKRDSPGGFHNSHDDRSGERQPNTQSTVMQFKSACGKCGARRIDSQLGLEKTPAEYVEKIVSVFREVRRVLKDDGTIWVNLGDCYSGGYGSGGRTEFAAKKRTEGMFFDGSHIEDGLKPKNLVGIPWRVAFALQADGWYLRSDIIWAKPNPMPESVTDRPTKSHEYLFLLAKSEKYYYDAEAIREPDLRRPYGSQGAWEMDGRPDEQKHGGEPRSWKGSQFHTGKTGDHQLGRSQKVRKPAGWDTGAGAHGTIHRNGRAPEIEYQDIDATVRNKRSVWTIATQPYPGAHFATFPEDLVKPCILAGCPVAGVVLDPFAGSGTVGKVALELGRRAVLIELSAEYCKLIEKRLSGVTYGLPLDSSTSSEPVMVSPVEPLEPLERDHSD